MCIVSAVIDDYRKTWPDHWPTVKPLYPSDDFIPEKKDNGPTQTQIDKLIKLLEQAAEYDRATNQKNCEKPELMKFMQDILDRFDKFQRKIEEILNPPKKNKKSKKK